MYICPAEGRYVKIIVQVLHSEETIRVANKNLLTF